MVTFEPHRYVWLIRTHSNDPINNHCEVNTYNRLVSWYHVGLTGINATWYLASVDQLDLPIDFGQKETSNVSL